MAKRLGISTTEVDVAIDKLTRVGLLKKEKGKYVTTQDYVVSPDGVPSEAIRNYHREMLGRAMQALELQSAQERQNVGMGFAINPKDLPRLKDEINNFVDELIERYSKKKGKIRLALQFNDYRRYFNGTHYNDCDEIYKID